LLRSFLCLVKCISSHLLTSMDSPFSISHFLTAFYATWSMCVLVFSDSGETQIFLLSIYITIVIGVILSMVRLILCSFVAIFFAYVVVVLPCIVMRLGPILVILVGVH
jgi:hypothetical protein